ncbi:MAG: ATP-dependent DNA helicase RecQ [Alcaligenaceae bacterium]|nr:ATP-dependent DNA helicase RecQ [Alcaligenaceae bacterium]
MNSTAVVLCDLKRALELLQIGSGCADAAFRDGQEDAIRHIVKGKGRLLVVHKAGWGKSFVYFIATKLQRLVEEGVVEKQKRPTGYVVKGKQLFD